MKIIDKVIQLLKNSKYQNNSVFDIASVIFENVPNWIKVNNENLGIDFFEIINIEDNTITFYCNAHFQDLYTVHVKIDKFNKLYISDFHKNSI